jgi:hypothetical protein
VVKEIGEIVVDLEEEEVVVVEIEEIEVGLEEEVVVAVVGLAAELWKRRCSRQYLSFPTPSSRPTTSKSIISLSADSETLLVMALEIYLSRMQQYKRSRMAACRRATRPKRQLQESPSLPATRTCPSDLGSAHGGSPLCCGQTTSKWLLEVPCLYSATE